MKNELIHKSDVINFAPFNLANIKKEYKNWLNDEDKSGFLLVDTVKMSYVAINGKCAWCGKDIKKVSVKHFDNHVKKENKK